MLIQLLHWPTWAVYIATALLFLAPVDFARSSKAMAQVLAHIRRR